MKNLLLLLLLAITTQVSADTPSYVSKVESAHGAEQWRQQQVFRTWASIYFGGNKIFDAKILVDIRNGRTRIHFKDGTVAVFDGKEGWLSPANAKVEKARFHLLTWSYFLAAPMKIGDKGAILKETGMKKLRNEDFASARLTFEGGVGDTPDDWYVLYQNPKTNLLEAMAYIVTFGKSAEQANKAPHIITFHDFAKVEGVTLSTRWKFWDWDSTEGTKGKSIGDAFLTQQAFVEVSKDFFSRPRNSRAIPYENKQAN